MGAGKGKYKKIVKGKRKESKANIGFRKTEKAKKRPTPLRDRESSGDEEVA